jgi:EcoRII C terminal
VLSTDDEIEDFFSAFGLSPTDTNRFIDKKLGAEPESKLIDCFVNYIRSLREDFPPTENLALNARSCYNNAYGVHLKNVITEPDGIILKWLTCEYQLFKFIENDRYKQRISTPFASVEDLVQFANSILNRRKSRAGKSLEHHLSAIFSSFSIDFQEQGVTEDNKKPDFLFPGVKSYWDSSFDAARLTVLACKTTCKDRWRQVLNEADRIPEKHLFTLQQGISVNQLKEMYKYGVRLVVPKPYVSAFPAVFRDQILTLEDFIQMIRSKQDALPLNLIS